jgi:hypothetical protein
MTTFNLRAAEIDAERLYQKNIGLAVVKSCLVMFAKTKDTDFIEFAKTIAQDHKDLENVYKQRLLRVL